jgi:hypothetical protein
MDWVGALQAHFGLVVFTLICIALTGYLAYAMVHPERF